MLGLLPQFNDINASMDIEKSYQNPSGQPGGGLPGEGYLKCEQRLKQILRWFIECVASASENNSRWEQVGKAESVEKSWY